MIATLLSTESLTLFLATLITCIAVDSEGHSTASKPTADASVVASGRMRSMV